MKPSFEELAELRKAEKTEPQTRTVINGYYALSDKDRALVDKNIRKFRNAIKNNDPVAIDFKGQFEE